MKEMTANTFLTVLITACAITYSQSFTFGAMAFTCCIIFDLLVRRTK